MKNKFVHFTELLTYSGIWKLNCYNSYSDGMLSNSNTSLHLYVKQNSENKLVGVWRASRYQRLTPTFPWIDNC